MSHTGEVNWNKPATARRPLLQEHGAPEELIQNLDHRHERPDRPVEHDILDALNGLIQVIGFRYRHPHLNQWAQEGQRSREKELRARLATLIERWKTEREGRA